MQTSIPNSSKLCAILAITAALSGCVRSEFIQTDSQFNPSPSKARPVVYIDRLPEKPYRSVGIIHVRARDNAELSAIIEEAGDQGQELGCHVVVDRALHQAPSRRPDSSLRKEEPDRNATAHTGKPEAAPAPNRGGNLLAQYAPSYGGGYAPVYIAPSQHREFICGIVDAWREDTSHD